MGEILRAVLDQSCTYSAPKIYTMPEITVAAGVTGPFSSFREFQHGRMFLVTSIVAYAVQRAVGASAMNANQAWSHYDINLRIQRSSRTIYSSDQAPSVLASSGYVTQSFDLPEYVLIDGHEVVELIGRRRGGIQAGAVGVSLVGIEYGK